MAVRSLVTARPVRPHSPSPKPHGLLVAFAAGLLLLLAVPLAASGAFYGLFALSDRIAQGVSVSGLSTGGLTVPEAAVALDGLWNKHLTIQVVDPPTSRAWTVKPAELGLRVDGLETARRAYAIGREQTLPQAIQSAAASLDHGVRLDPVVHLDLSAARRRLEALASEVSTSAQDARVEIMAGEIRVTPATEGRTLDVEATLALMAADPVSLLVDYGFVPLIFTSQPPAIWDVRAPAEKAERLLSAEPVLQVYDPVTDEWFRWSPDKSTIGDWIILHPGEDAEDVGLDMDRIAQSVQAWAAELGPERQIDEASAVAALEAGLEGRSAEPVVITYRPRPSAANGGESLASIGYRHGFPTWKIQEYNPGPSPYLALPAGTEITLPPRDAMLLLPVIPGKRIIISISEQHLWTYEDGRQRSDHVISTGIARSPTLPGLFQVLSHVENAYASRWDLWMPHFLGIYDALPGFTNGIHGLPLLSSGVRLWANVLGRPASYGCIILDLAAAEDLYHWADDGVVVEIRR